MPWTLQLTAVWTLVLIPEWTPGLISGETLQEPILPAALILPGLIVWLTVVALNLLKSTFKTQQPDSCTAKCLRGLPILVATTVTTLILPPGVGHPWTLQHQEAAQPWTYP
jgi:hypothetical protein